MDTFLTFVLLPLYVATLGGLAALAVKMPAVYHEIAGKLGAFFFVAGLTIGVWHFAIGLATTLLVHAMPDREAVIRETLVSIQLPAIFSACMVLASVVTVGLIYVANTVQKHRPKRDE